MCNFELALIQLRTPLMSFKLLWMLCFYLSSGDVLAQDGASFTALRIAHAGGALGRKTYTNSYEALDANLERGFRYFEIDWVFTSDEQLVCLHDWKDNFTRTFGHRVEAPLTLAEFQSLARDNPKFTNCTLAGLAHWMRQHPTAMIVTDVRGNNMKALRKIRRALPDSANRVIPQIYKPVNYEKVRAMGYQQIIWTLYRFPGNDSNIMQWASRFKGPFAVAMPAAKARTSLPETLSALGIPTYTHTINREAEMRQLMDQYGVTEIYTDRLAPATP